MKKLAPFVVALAFLIPAFASAQSTCVTSLDCAVGQECIGGSCTSPVGTCTTDVQCSAGQSCVGGSCTTSAGGGICNTSADCSFGQSCVNGSCTSASTSNGASCASDSDCASYGTGYSCEFGSCVNAGTGSTGATGATTNTSGAGGINTSYLQGYEQTIVSVINTILVPLLVAVAFIIFLWGVFNYFIRGAAEPEKRKEGAQFVLWAVIGFAIIFSVWGLVNLVLGTLGIPVSGTHPLYPTL